MTLKTKPDLGELVDGLIELPELKETQAEIVMSVGLPWLDLDRRTKILRRGFELAYFSEAITSIVDGAVVARISLNCGRVILQGGEVQGQG